MRDRSTLALTVIFKEARVKWKEPKTSVNNPAKEAGGGKPCGVWCVLCTGEATWKKLGKG